MAVVVHLEWARGSSHSVVAEVAGFLIVTRWEDGARDLVVPNKGAVVRVAVGSDHAGFELKESLKTWLEASGHEVNDVGTHSTERSDYPTYGTKVAELVASGQADRGVAVCGSGQGICMSVNRVHGARGGILRDAYDAEMTRLHNDANVACFGERVTDAATAQELLALFLATEFEGGRHALRVEQLDQLT